MKLYKEIFNTLFDGRFLGDKKLVELNKEITNLEESFKNKHGSEVFRDYCVINDLLTEELMYSSELSFKVGFEFNKLYKKCFSDNK